jgi:hypothetical protein
MTLPSLGTPDPAAPQQSLSCRQRSPSMWQPFAGWQILTPVLRYGAHNRLQQSVQAPHTMPSTPPLQKDDPVGGLPHVPSVAPLAMLHVPLQHAFPVVQTSPVCTQKDELSEQIPFEHRWLQQSALAAQWLPAVLHVVLSGVHLPLPHVPLQQSAFAVHAALSDVQIVPVHLPLVHVSEQQSVFVVHAELAAPHCPTPAVHVFVAASHFCEQHSPSALHVLPDTPHPD